MARDGSPWARPLGALPREDGSTLFRVWAPGAAGVGARLGDTVHPLDPESEGIWSAVLPARPGDRYTFVLGGAAEWPDPWSRFQPEGLRGPSEVVDTAPFAPAREPWAGVAPGDLVIYELHVGTFSPEGTFDGVIPRLGELAELGITAIELMPVATGPGRRGWGYDGVYAFAPHAAYGGPPGLARLVAAAHANGIAVLLDVVYNHVGPGSEALAAFGPYFTDRYDTFWGDAINFDGPDARGVREWAIQNASMWIGEYGVDGLRLDAVHAIFDQGPRHVMAELADRVREINPRTIVTSEMEIGDLRPIREWGHDAQWEDSLHHGLHTLLTGESEGYYADYGRMEHLARSLELPDAEKLIVCAQNHDQVGNRAVGDRLRGEKLRLAALCSLLSPFTPLLFMGEEYDESRPFQYFTDHIDREIAEATRAGRRREFAAFADFSGEDVPDPQAEETFLSSKLDPAGGDPAHRAFYAELLRRRRELPAGPVSTDYDEHARWMRVRRGPVELLLNFSAAPQEIAGRTVAAWSGEMVS